MTSDSESARDADEPWALRQGRLIVILGGGLTVFVGLLAVFVLPTIDRFVGDFTGGDLQRARADLRSSGLALATGVGAATAGLLAWGRLELSRRQHQLDRARDVTSERNQTAQHLLAEQSQRSDRFARAIELLGDADGAVRLGALYALEGLAKDGYEEQSVYDVICAFARLHVPQYLAATVETAGAANFLPDFSDPVESSTDGDVDVERLADPEPSEDYEAALAIALRVSPAMNIHLNLSGTVLNGKVIPAIADCSLQSSAITGCRFEAALIRGVDFALARVSGCTFDGVTFYECGFGEAVLDSCSFEDSSCDVHTTWPAGAIPAGVAVME